MATVLTGWDKKRLDAISSGKIRLHWSLTKEIHKSLAEERTVLSIETKYLQPQAYPTSQLDIFWDTCIWFIKKALACVDSKLPQVTHMNPLCGCLGGDLTRSLASYLSSHTLFTLTPAHCFTLHLPLWHCLILTLHLWLANTWLIYCHLLTEISVSHFIL